MRDANLVGGRWVRVPLVGLALDADDSPWSTAWLESRSALHVSGTNPLCLRLMQKGVFGVEPMTPNEGAACMAYHIPGFGQEVRHTRPACGTCLRRLRLIDAATVGWMNEVACGRPRRQGAGGGVLADTATVWLIGGRLATQGHLGPISVRRLGKGMT
eukprot:6216696-Amphidinium_carterae.2